MKSKDKNLVKQNNGLSNISLMDVNDNSTTKIFMH